MKIEEITRQEGGLGNLDVICYALDDEGRYTTAVSSGWEPKTIAMEASLRMVDEQTEEARRQVLAGTRSPIVYHTSSSVKDVFCRQLNINENVPKPFRLIAGTKVVKIISFCSNFLKYSSGKFEPSIRV